MAIVVSKLTAGANVHLTTSEEANGVYTDFVGQGIVGAVGNTSGVAPSTGGFSVNAQGTPDNTIAVAAGVAYVTGTPTSQNSQTFRVKNSASANTTISANASGSTKYDWVYITLSATNLNTPNTAGDNVATITVSRSSSASADDGTPPTYGYNIAVVTVANGFTTITNGNIADKRAQVILATGASNPAGGWTATSTPTTITALGNRSYTVLFPSVDLTGTLFKGMRLKGTRTVTAPTQCTSLNGTTQYYSKASPAGSTFTDDFVTGWWIKPSSYAVGTIASIYNGTSGWALRMNASGQIQLIGYNAGAANFSQVLSNQSVALNKWTHVAAQLDMSAFTATPTTSYVMLDGLDVPAAVSRGGTNPTALVQAGNLNIGAENGGTSPFPGKIANGGFYSAKVTQATMLASIHQTLAGTETSLVSAYSFNNTINDLNANANNLTANGSAVATNLDTPFTQTVTGVTTGTTNFGIITAISFSTNTTVTVQVPEGDTLPASGGISAVSYSGQRSPFGLSMDKSKWRLATLWRLDTNVTSNATYGAFSAGGYALNVQIGAWDVGHAHGSFGNGQLTLVTFNISSTALTGLTVAAGNNASPYGLSVQSPVAGVQMTNPGYVSKPQNLTSAATYVMYTVGATTGAAIFGTQATSEIFAEFNLL